MKHVKPLLVRVIFAVIVIFMLNLILVLLQNNPYSVFEIAGRSLFIGLVVGGAFYMWDIKEDSRSRSGR